MAALTTVEVATTIDAPAGTVWRLLSDLSRMGDWSPETDRVVWKGGATGPVEGARFGGRNRHKRWVWTTSNEIVTAVPDREIAWRTTLGPLKVSLWRYTLREVDGATTVTETWVDERGGLLGRLGALGTGVADRRGHNERTMTETLARLKAAAEAT